MATIRLPRFVISSLYVTSAVSSDQIDPRHMKGTTYRCFLPDLTRFMGFHCVGPSHQSRRPSGLRKTRRESNSLAHRTTWLRSDFPYVTSAVSSDQIDPRHMKGTTYRCFLPDLTRFMGFHCVGPSHQQVGGQAVLGRQDASPTPWLTERHGYDPTCYFCS